MSNMIPDSQRSSNDRAFIAAILVQAFNDSLSHDYKSDPLGARRFIDDQNELFCMYCELLDLNPSYLAKKMKQKIREHTFKPLKEFRE